MNNLTIYFGTKQICFSDNDKYPLMADENLAIISSATSSKKLKQDVEWFLKQKKFNSLYFHSQNTTLTKENFFKTFRVIEAGGGFITSKDGALFIFRNKKWDLPKGKIDKGETIRQAAVRECEEECAITGLHLRKQLPETYHFYKLKGKLVIKKTYWFGMTTHAGQKLKPQKEEGISRIKWFKKEEIDKAMKNTFPGIRDVTKAMKWI